MKQLLVTAGAIAALLGPASPASAACALAVDPAGGGTHTTIQAAIDALPDIGPCTIAIKAGTYREALVIASRNTAADNEAQRILIEAAGKVVIDPPAGRGVTISSSRFVTVRGLSITGAEDAGILLDGRDAGNRDVHLVANDVYSNAAGGIVVGANNARAWIVNNLVRNNGRNGITAEGRPSQPSQPYIVNNTIVGNRWNGVLVSAHSEARLVNNLIVANGTDRASVGGRWGFLRDQRAGATSATTLLNNVFYRNGVGAAADAGGDIGHAAQTLDAADRDNRVTAALSVPGIAGCVFSPCSAAPGLAALFDRQGLGPRFEPAAISPLLGRGATSFVEDGTEWVPAADFDGTTRGEKVEVGYLEQRRTNPPTIP